MADQYFANALSPFHLVVGVAKNTFTAYQDVSPLPLPVLGGYQLRQGSKLELEAVGEFSTTGTPTFSLGFIYGATAGAAGGVALGQSDLVAVAGAATNFPWHLRYIGTVVSVGATGTIVGHGVLELGTSLIAQVTKPTPTTQALRTTTIDTTVQKLLGVGAQFGTSNVANQVIVNDFRALLIN